MNADLMEMVIGSFKNELRETSDIINLEKKLSRLKISRLIIKNKETRFEMKIVFLENGIEKTSDKIEIGFMPRDIKLKKENQKINQINFCEFGRRNCTYNCTVKVHLH